MFFVIRETLTECTAEDIKKRIGQYVAVLTNAEWQAQKDGFDMGMDLEPDAATVHNTKAEVNYDSLTGTFCIPNRKDISGEEYKFAFALDEKGIVFIDDGGYVLRQIEDIRKYKKWRMPSLERFLYDFLEQIIHPDLALLERYEKELDRIEDAILDGAENANVKRVYEIRNDMRDLKTHYEQLMDLGQEMEENENHFFQEENVRYFRLFSDRVSRLTDTVTALRDYAVQIRDLYQAQLDVKQNRIMTLLTVVTTIFMPLTLIVGWYGMNFRYMPELEWRYAYPAVAVVSLVIVVGSLIFFKAKKWL
ncbi:MAG: magnesium transporter CorA [Lachnospiraceae bacterium]|nr:magnesium transporter CorA [Lachnospiraceae bacterium]